MWTRFSADRDCGIKYTIKSQTLEVTLSQLSRLARLLKLTERQAWDFFQQVRQYFDKSAPNIETVVKCVEANSVLRLTPQIVTQRIKESGEGNEATRGGPKPKPTMPSPTKPTKPPTSSSPLSTYKKARRKNRSGD